MSVEFHRDYLSRLPLPLAQLYSRAYNAADYRGRHDNTFYLFEDFIKLGASILTASYLADIRSGGSRIGALDRQLAQLALPSLGQWVGIFREVARHYGKRIDAEVHPLGQVWKQLTIKHSDKPGLIALYRRIQGGPDGQPGNDTSVAIMELFDALVQYRNGVFGHGAARFESFYEHDMGPLLFPAVNELLAEGVLEPMGVKGSRLACLNEIRKLDDQRSEIRLAELTDREPLRMAPRELTCDEASQLIPGCVAVLWPARRMPLRLDPLLVFRGTDQEDEVLFLNRDRNGRQVEYLSYTTGRTERDKSMAPALAVLMSQITGRSVGEEELQKFSQQSIAETPSVEAFFEPPDLQGTIRGDFELLAELGRGGMGIVYLARQLSLGRFVALKTLPADLVSDTAALSRFQREMRALSRCDHPNIVKLLSSGAFPDGQMYYTMEYVPGADLEHVWRELAKPDEKLTGAALGSTTWSHAVLSAARKQRSESSARKGLESTQTGTTTRSEKAPTAISREEPLLKYLPPLPEMPPQGNDPGGYFRKVAMLIRDAAKALQEIHDRGLIHRDIKPANLMLTPDGARVVLMDFGLVKGGNLPSTTDRSKGFLGTLRYAAPEQLAVASLKVGPTADVRGLGVTMWELLTRRRLFADAHDEAQLTSWVLHRELPQLRKVDRTADRDLEAIVAKATEREAARRIQTARELADYLDLYLDGKSLPIRVPGRVELWGRFLRRNAAVVSVTVLIGVFAVYATVALTNNWRRASLLAELTKLHDARNLTRENCDRVESLINRVDTIDRGAAESERRKYIDSLIQSAGSPTGPGLSRLRDALQYFESSSDEGLMRVRTAARWVAFRASLAPNSKSQKLDYLVRHNPNRISDLESIVHIAEVLSSSPEKDGSDIRLFLLRAYMAEGALPKAKAYAERLLDQPNVPAICRLQIYRELAWVALSSNNPQWRAEVEKRITDQLQKAAEEAAALRFAELHIEYARCLHAQGRLHDAKAQLEKYIEAQEQGDLDLHFNVANLQCSRFSDGGPNDVNIPVLFYLDAVLLRGMIAVDQAKEANAEAGVDLPAAQEIWKAGYAKVKSTPSGTAYEAAVLGSLSRQIDFKDVQLMIANTAETAGETSPLVSMFEELTKDSKSADEILKPVVGVLNRAWRSSQGWPLARGVALHTLPFEEFKHAQFRLWIFEGFRWAIAGDIDASNRQDEVLWRLANDLCEDFVENRITEDDLVAVFFEYAVSSRVLTDSTTWPKVVDRLPPRIRAPLSYVFGKAARRLYRFPKLVDAAVQRFFQLTEPVDSGAPYFRYAEDHLEHSAHALLLQQLLKDEKTQGK